MIGIDFIRISRIAEALKRQSFLNRAFTPSEREYYLKKGEKAETLAGIFAAKEATVKALGCGFKAARPEDIEIIYDEFGKPRAKLGEKLRKMYSVSEIELSITHDGDFAFAAAGNDCEKIVEEGRGCLEYAAAGEEEPVLSLRNELSHKGNYGRIYVIGGSPEMPGAPLLCALAALSAGGGLVTLCVPQSMALVYQRQSLQNTLCFLPDKDGKILYDEKTLDKILSRADAVVIGMGMGKNERLGDIIGYLSRKPINLIVDADGLNNVCDNREVFDNHMCRLILTPHVGEFKRFGYGDDNAEVIRMAKDLDATVMRKSAVTIISDGNIIKRAAFGTPALAKGGSGDILAGITAALCDRLIPIDACLKACYVIGDAAKRAETQVGENSVTAELLIKNIRVY